MVGILAQVDDIFSWASRGEKLIGTGWGMRIQGHGYLNILCRCNIRRSARGQREHGFLLDQHYAYYLNDSQLLGLKGTCLGLRAISQPSLSRKVTSS